MQQQVRYPFGGCRTCFRMPAMGIPSPTDGYAGVIVLLFRSGLIVGTVFLKKFLCTDFNVCPESLTAGLKGNRTGTDLFFTRTDLF